MKRHFAIFLVPCFLGLFSINAFAVGDFSGDWVADAGTVSSNVGLNAKCSRVEIVMEQSEHALVIRKYKADCQLFGSTWGPVTEDIEGGKVLERGDVVGSITDDTLLTTSQDGSVAYAFNLKLVRGANGQVLLKSYYGTQNAVGAIAIEAELHRVSGLTQ